MFSLDFDEASIKDVEFMYPGRVSRMIDQGCAIDDEEGVHKLLSNPLKRVHLLAMKHGLQLDDSEALALIRAIPQKVFSTNLFQSHLFFFNPFLRLSSK